MHNNAFRNLALFGAVVFPTLVTAAPAALVTNGSDSGSGSLRAALESGATHITIDASVAQISIDSTLLYTGTAPLKINGSGQIISGDTGSEPLFEISAGADLTVSSLEFAGPGGFSIENQGGGKGIFVKIPASKTGTVNVSLTGVTVRDTGNHGVHISDCSTGDDCGAGQGGAGDGSDASVSVKLTDVLIDRAGFGKQDADGLRVDDRGPGDIIFSASNSEFSNVGGDGIELDEGDEGSVIIKLANVAFYDNGAYCSDDFVSDPIALDPKCDDDGDPDVDDAFDIDEAGTGGIQGSASDLVIINNYDEGLDFDTEGDTGENVVDLKLTNIYARDNDDEAIKVSEEGNASVYVSMNSLDIGGDVQVEEEDDGDLRVTINNSYIGDDLKLSEDGNGDGTVKLRDTYVNDDLDFEDVSQR